MTLTLSNFRRSSAAALALAACLVAGTSYAASPAAPSVSVRYGDLDLTTDKGVNTLYARVSSAARHVCAADAVDIRNLAAYAAERACESQAIEHAVQQVQAPKVAARLAARHEG